MNEEMNHYGYCGLDCKECPVFLATINDDDNLREKTAREWSKHFSTILPTYVGKDSLSLEDMNCCGCRSEQSPRFVGCVNCPIRACCSGNGYESCARCGRFDACDMIAGFFQVHEQAKANLTRMRNAISKAD